MSSIAKQLKAIRQALLNWNKMQVIGSLFKKSTKLEDEINSMENEDILFSGLNIVKYSILLRKLREHEWVY